MPAPPPAIRLVAAEGAFLPSLPLTFVAILSDMSCVRTLLVLHKSTVWACARCFSLCIGQSFSELLVQPLNTQCRRERLNGKLDAGHAGGLYARVDTTSERIVDGGRDRVEIGRRLQPRKGRRKWKKQRVSRTELQYHHEYDIRRDERDQPRDAEKEDWRR